MNKDLHNPAGVSDASLGPHHKLLSTEDLDKPLSEGAEYWDDDTERWEASEYAKMERKPATTLTYRIPLTLSDRLKAERDRAHEEVTRISELIKVVEAVEKGAEYEVMWPPNAVATGHWKHPVKDVDYYIKEGFKLRIKPLPPTPQTIPWTLETRPLTEVWVKRKDRSEEQLIVMWQENGAIVIYEGLISYETLHRDWLQRNGEPAGEKVKV